MLTCDIAVGVTTMPPGERGHSDDARASPGAADLFDGGKSTSGPPDGELPDLAAAAAGESPVQPSFCRPDSHADDVTDEVRLDSAVSSTTTDGAHPAPDAETTSEAAQGLLRCVGEADEGHGNYDNVGPSRKHHYAGVDTNTGTKRVRLGIVGATETASDIDGHQGGLDANEIAPRTVRTSRVPLARPPPAGPRSFGLYAAELDPHLLVDSV